MASPDKIDAAIQDMVTRLSTISAVENKTVTVYDHEQMAHAHEKLMSPCIGVLYNRLQGVGDKGGAANLFVDCVVIYSDEASDSVSSAQPSALGLLWDMIQSVLTKSAGDRDWFYVTGSPLEHDGKLAYMQRWRTRITILQNS